VANNIQIILTDLQERTVTGERASRLENRKLYESNLLRRAAVPQTRQLHVIKVGQAFYSGHYNDADHNRRTINHLQHSGNYMHHLL
jgi:hypothetical protein